MRALIFALMALAACNPGGDDSAAVDADGDGWSAGQDCDDGDHAVNPDASEICDGVDDDCDGLVDDEDDDLDLATVSPWCLDADGDGYGDPEAVAMACAAPAGSVADCTDCDDSEAGIFPGATPDDEPNGVDDDCDGYVDEGQAYLGDFDLGAHGVTLTGCYDHAGFVVAGAGDVDHDGHDDVAVGAPYHGFGSTYRGVVYLMFGPLTVDRSLCNADVTLVGEEEWYASLFDISGAGDVDGDGHDDLLVGVSPHGYPGSAYLLYGPLPAGERSLADADVFIPEAGQSFAGAGDVDGDGRDDLLIGCTIADPAGGVWLLRGPVRASVDLAESALLMVGEHEEDLAAYATGAGDVDGDVLDDVLVAAPWSDDVGVRCGAVYQVCSPPAGPGVISLADADAKLLGEREGDGVGTLGRAGDVDGDGYADVLIGASGQDLDGENAGAVYVIYGPIAGERSLAAADARLGGEEAGANAGSSVGGAGDVDGDGRDDVLIGAPAIAGAPVVPGVAYLQYGPVLGELDLADADVLLLGARRDYAGWSVAGAGDVDGDGHADVLVGVPYEGDTVITGAAHLLHWADMM